MSERGPIRGIVGYPSNWGLIGSISRPRPYRLTAGATDTMRVRVREKIDIHGVGTDVVEMEGVFVVRRDHPRGAGSAEAKWAEATIKTEFRALELFGQSDVFGTVRVRLNPQHSSTGEVSPAEHASQAAACKADLYPIVELPELGMTISTADKAVTLASKVISIPPVGDVARSESPAALVDERGRTVGEIVSSDIEVGQVLASIPLGNTERQAS